MEPRRTSPIFCRKKQCTKHTSENEKGSVSSFLHYIKEVGMELIKLFIDEKAIVVKKGTTILHAAQSSGIEIPTHCHDDQLRPYGGCRMCLVEITKNDKKKLVASCLYEVEEGLVVKTRTGEIDKIRKMIIELTWPILSQYAEEYGAQNDRFQNENPDCSLCGKCMRFCAESNQWDIVYIKGRGINRDIDLSPNHEYDYTVYKQCMAYCAAGRLRNKLLSLWGE
jgi:bidirectional [NiFe] hydrogenase diaphorase subunit